MAVDRTDSDEREARLKLLIEAYRARKERRLVRRAIRLWRQAEAQLAVIQNEQQPDRIH
jgi:hypothetical protein